jgi:hypothetical protein
MFQKIYKVVATVIGALVVCAPATSSKEFVSTGAYRWCNDSIVQGPYTAYAPSPTKIISNYSAVPGYKMPVDKVWELKNDISAYPRLSTPNTLHNAIFNMALDEMVNAVEPDSTLRTGREWPGVWTRDVSYSIILAMAALQPEVSRISLEHKITPSGRIVQDTGSGGAWPVSSDRQIWGIAAFEVYKVTGDTNWLRRIYPIIRNSLADDYATIYDSQTGLVHGETSFIDWREQSYPTWMQTADIYQSEALGTSVVHAQAWRTLARIADILGDKADAALYNERADQLAKAINNNLWLNDKGYYAMYLYGCDHLIVNPRAETLGESLSILFDVADSDKARLITEKNPTTPFGTAIFYPQIADQPAYHNNALWPWVAAYWTLANAKVGNAEGVMQGIGSIFRPAALFTTNKENFVLDNGDIGTELNSSNMLWCLSGNIAVTMKMLFGVNFDVDGVHFAPFVPKELADTRSLNNVHYRNATLNIVVSGYGSRIRRFQLNGVDHEPFLPANISGENNITIEMENNNPEPMRVNNVNNAKAPLTPVVWLSHSEEIDYKLGPVNNLLKWNPIEYIDHYIVLRDGKQITQTNETSWMATVPGEYQVIGVSGSGLQSFASQPRSNVDVLNVSFDQAITVTSITSTEAVNVPRTPIYGFHGKGFAESDHNATSLKTSAKVDSDGTYAIALRYANGNGPVNTENKCAIRTLFVDGQRCGTVVMPQRGVGNWNDWGTSNSVTVPLTAGTHTFEIRFLPENENMNGKVNHALIDDILLRRLQ